MQAPHLNLEKISSCAEGESLVLDVEVLESATYVWSDGTTSPSIEITQSGLYAVSISSNGCISEDQVTINFQALPIFSLGPDTSICSGQSLDFDLSTNGDQFLWQDGSTNGAYQTDEAGVIWLEIIKNNCAFRDSINIQVVEAPQVDLGQSQRLCDGEISLLDATNLLADTYLWSDGSSSPTLSVSQAGTYAVSVTANGCTTEDQVEISFKSFTSI